MAELTKVKARAAWKFACPGCNSGYTADQHDFSGFVECLICGKAFLIELPKLLGPADDANKKQNQGKNK